MDIDSDVKDPKFADFYGPAKPKNTPPDKWSDATGAEFLDDWRVKSVIREYSDHIAIPVEFIDDKGHMLACLAHLQK